MDTIRTPTRAEVTRLIDGAIKDVASWPLWKANPEVILAARKMLKERGLDG